MEKLSKHVNSDMEMIKILGCSEHTPGGVELFTIEQYKRNAEVNLYGYIRIIKGFLPLIRRSKELSSYNMTKFAIEALSDALRLEMQKFGVKVVIIQPGDFDQSTAISSQEQVRRMTLELDEMWEAATDEVRNAYGRKYIDRTRMGIEGSETSVPKTSPRPVLHAIEDGLLSVNPEQRYLVAGAGFPVDKFAVIGKIYKYLPDFIRDTMRGKVLTEF